MWLGFPIYWWICAGILVVFFYVAMSMRRVGPSEVGLVLKRASLRRLSEDNAIGFLGEPGYQADLLMPGAAGSRGCFTRCRNFRGCRFPRAKSAWSSRRWARRCRSARNRLFTRKSFGKLFRSALLCHQRRAEGRAAAGISAGNTCAHSSRRLYRDHQEPGLRPAGIAGTSLPVGQGMKR